MEQSTEPQEDLFGADVAGVEVLAEVTAESAATPTVAEFQRSASAQGRQFAEQCDQLLEHYGFTLSGKLVIAEIGVEVDQVATSTRTGRTIWFEYKGSVQGSRPGLLRTDTLKKAIANGALMNALGDHPPYIIVTSHAPDKNAGFAMLTAAKKLGYFDDVICLYNPVEVNRLRGL